MPVAVGQLAPPVDLPAANRDGDVSIARYRGRSPVLLALFRGLYCPFCRHQIAQLGVIANRLREAGIETLGVVATPAERARLYFRFRQAPIPLGADPDLITHHAYGLPRVPLTAAITDDIMRAAVEWARETGTSTEPAHAYAALARFDGFEATRDDEADLTRHQAQFIGQFLIDMDGVVRWVKVERQAGDFPTVTEILAVIR